MRKNVRIDFVTPLAEAFSKQATAKVMGNLLQERGINMVANFGTEHMDKVCIVKMRLTR